MTQQFRTSFLLEANATGAKAALVQTSQEFDKLTKSTTRASEQGNRLATSTKKLGEANVIAAGSVANLTAQFNDIGVMLMAGQNPLTLAVQQGTQITQVLGPMGARGAVRALGSAFMGMLSPVNLITIGSIAAGAAMVQWLTSGKEAAVTAEDAISDLSSSIKDYRAALDDLRAPHDDMIAKYGSMAEAALKAKAAILEVKQARAESDIGQAVEAVAGDLLTSHWIMRGTSGEEKAQFLKDSFGLARAEAEALQRALVDLDTAEGLKGQAAAASEVSRVLKEAYGSVGAMPEPLQIAYEQMAMIVDKAAEHVGITEATVLSVGDLIDAASAFSAGLSGVIGQTAGIAENLAAAASNAWDMAQAWDAVRFKSKLTDLGDDERGSQREVVKDGNEAAREAAWRDINARLRPAKVGAAGRSGTSEYDSSLRAAQSLFEETRTAAERYAAEVAKINALHAEFPGIVTDQVQARALDRLKEDFEEVGSLGKDAASAIRGAFDGIFDDPKEALKDLAAQLAQMALYQQLGALFPSMFGAGGFMPLLSRAEGGPITGPGTGTSDSILMWGSNGEYMVNAASTAKYRPLLEAINADKSGRLMQQMLPRRATGGIIGADTWAPSAVALRSSGASTAAAPVHIKTSVTVENYTGEPAREERRTGPDGEEMIAIVVGKQWAAGKFDQSNRGRYGARPNPVKR